ncbi:MAG: agmatinase family protein [Ekhidna sp.]|nr:agmatinase family protein [Ekhidna sp.]
MMYNPSEVGKKGSIFGLPYSEKEADIVFIPVHLDVTVSYGQGTAKAPDYILDESSQLDLSLNSIENPWELKMAMSDRLVLKNQNEIYRGRALNVIKSLEAGKNPDSDHLRYVNEYCEKVHERVEEAAVTIAEKGKIPCVVGGDHSSPLGLIRALTRSESFGILQIDAHMDLRSAYEGFIYSHASIMFNVIKEGKVSSLTQVGIRDYCEEEEVFVKQSKKPIHVFYDEAIYRAGINGINWIVQVDQIIETLPDQVYVSFDVDGLDPSLCPNTGTPVPGGLQFNDTIYLVEQVVRSGRQIIGFDVCETGKSAWDANVASRVLYRLAVLTGVSNGLLKFKG